jgi:hypothetical protein
MMSRVARAELRIYAPLSSFPAPERERWEEYVAAGRRAPDLREESPAGWASLERLLAMAEAGDHEAYIMTAGDEPLVCPRRLDLRSIVGMLAFRRAVTPILADAILTKADAERMAAEFERLKARHPARRSQVRASAWHVPVPWFAAFEEAERRYGVSGEGVAGITYLTSVRDAARRLDRAASVGEVAGIQDVVIDPLRSIEAWLEPYPDEARLELDYGTVADLFTAESLADDRSAFEVSASVEALARGDVMRSGFHFAAVQNRWSAVRSVGELS